MQWLTLSWAWLPQYGTALGGSLRLFAALKSLFTNHFNSFVPVEREHIIAGKARPGQIGRSSRTARARADGLPTGTTRGQGRAAGA